MCSTPTVRFARTCTLAVLPISNRAHSTALQSGHIYYHIIQYDGILLHGSLLNHIPPEYVYRLQDLNLRIPTERDLKSRAFSKLRQTGSLYKI